MIDWPDMKLPPINLHNVTRLEVIGPNGRDFVRYLKDDEEFNYSVQDDGRTLKIFIDNKK